MQDVDLMQPDQSETKESESGKENIKPFNHIYPLKRTLKQKLSDFFRNPKKRLIFIICFGLVAILLVWLGLYKMSGYGKADDITKNTEQESVGTATDPAPLSGVLVSPEAAARHPLAIMVENHPDARPQAGLDKADIVYEALAEGGITRFLALFASQEAEKVGPVRSARTYFVDWARGYSAYLAHVGGNIDALDQIRTEKVFDLDQFSFSAPYWRENRAGLATEHTMFTSTPKLREQAANNKYPTANNFNLMKFKDDPTGTEKTSLPSKQQITVDFSNSSYKVEFSYDKKTNSYTRSLAGSPHVDQISKQQINPKNIIAMTVQRKPTLTRINEPGYEMTTVGSGTAKIFIDGKTINGTWKKTAKTDREFFYDSEGNEITFNRGQFWICVIPPDAKVTAE